MLTLEQALRLPTWRRHAACRTVGPALFYSRDSLSQQLALELCRGCGVRERCLADAVAEELDDQYVYGIRGGATAAQRRALEARAAG